MGDTPTVPDGRRPAGLWCPQRKWQQQRRRSASRCPTFPSLSPATPGSTLVSHRISWYKQTHTWAGPEGRLGAMSPSSGPGPPLRCPFSALERPGPERAAGAGTYLGVVLSTREEGQLVGGGEVGSNLLHLPETLPLPPLGPPVLEPDLQDRADVAGVRPEPEASPSAAQASPSSPASRPWGHR